MSLFAAISQDATLEDVTIEDTLGEETKTSFCLLPTYSRGLALNYLPCKTGSGPKKTYLIFHPTYHSFASSMSNQITKTN